MDVALDLGYLTGGKPEKPRNRLRSSDIGGSNTHPGGGAAIREERIIGRIGITDSSVVKAKCTVGGKRE